MTSFIIRYTIFLGLSTSCYWKSSAFSVAPQPRSSTIVARAFSSDNNDDPPCVLCIGDALFDCIANNDARGCSVDEMITRNAWKAFPGGAPANVATALQKLGTSSAFVGCLGTDPDGDELVTLLNDTGVDTSLVQRTSEHPTRRVMVTRSLEGDREFGGFYNHDSQSADASADSFSDCFLQVDSLLEKLEKEGRSMKQGTKWVVCSTLSLAFETSAKAVQGLVQKLVLDNQQNNCRLLIDVNWRPVFWGTTTLTEEAAARKEIMEFVQQADVVKLTDEEAEWLLLAGDSGGMTAESALKHPEQVHSYFPNACALLLTAGEKGASYSIQAGTDGKQFYKGMVPPFVVDVTETTGAGDAFTAGFLHGILQKCNNNNILPATQEGAHELVTFAAVVGALTCTKEGAIAAQPTFDQVEAFLIHGEKVCSKH